MQGSRFATVKPAVVLAKVNYGRPLMRKLVGEANSLGIAVSFYNDQDGRYVIKTTNGVSFPPTAAAACHFVMGMIELAKIRHACLFPNS